VLLWSKYFILRAVKLPFAVKWSFRWKHSFRGR